VVECGAGALLRDSYSGDHDMREAVVHWRRVGDDALYKSQFTSLYFTQKINQCGLKGRRGKPPPSAAERVAGDTAARTARQARPVPDQYALATDEQTNRQTNKQNDIV